MGNHGSKKLAVSLEETEQKKEYTDGMIACFSGWVLQATKANVGHDAIDPKSQLAVFSEEYRPLETRPTYDWRTGEPSLADVNDFITKITTNLAVPMEIVIAVAVYSEKLESLARMGALSTKFVFTEKTWRRLLVHLVAIALKMWEDARFFNEDCVRYLDLDGLTLKDMSVMERRGFRMLQYSAFADQDTTYSTIASCVEQSKILCQRLKRKKGHSDFLRKLETMDSFSKALAMELATVEDTEMADAF